MGLIKCPECGKEISDMAQSCPNCGCPLKRMQQNDINRGVNFYGTWEQSQSKNTKKKSHGCLIAFLVMILVILFILALVGVGAGVVAKRAEDSFGDKVNVSDASETDSEIRNIEQNINEKTEEQNENVYVIGETASLKDWSIVVTDFKIVDTINDNYGYFSPDSENGKYAQVFVTVTNNGKQSMTFLPSFGLGDDVGTKLLYGDNYEFSATDLIGYSNEIHDAGLNPMSSQSGEVVFEIPDSVASSTDEIIIQFTSGNDKVQFKVR